MASSSNISLTSSSSIGPPDSSNFLASDVLGKEIFCLLLLWCCSESFWLVLTVFIWLARVHVLIYFSGQLHDLNFLKAVFLFLILSLSQTACSFSSVNIPQYNLKSSQQHFQFQAQKPSSAVVYVEPSLSKQLLDWGSKNEPISFVSTKSRSFSSHTISTEQREGEEQRASRCKIEEKWNISKECKQRQLVLGELLVLSNHWHMQRQPSLKLWRWGGGITLYTSTLEICSKCDRSISQYRVRWDRTIYCCKALLINQVKRLNSALFLIKNNN